MTVSDLIKIYLDDCKLKSNSFGSKKVYFGLENVGMIPSSTRIAEVKNKLHNQQVKKLEFSPVLYQQDESF